MSDDDKLALQYRMIEVWEKAYLRAYESLQDEDVCRKTADKAVQACKKAVGLQ